MHAYIFESFTIDCEGGGNFHVAVIEGSQFFFPVIIFELQEQSSDKLGIIEPRVVSALYLSGRELFAWLGRLHVLAAPARAGTPRTATFGLLFLKELPRGFAFSVIQALIAVCIELF